MIEPDARGIIYRRSDGWREAHIHHLAQSPCAPGTARIWDFQYHDVHLARDIKHGWHQIGGQVTGEYLSIIFNEVFQHCVANRLNQRTLDLSNDVLGIDGLTHIDSAVDFLDFHQPGFDIYDNFSSLGCISIGYIRVALPGFWVRRSSLMRPVSVVQVNRSFFIGPSGQGFFRALDDRIANKEYHS